MGTARLAGQTTLLTISFTTVRCEGRIAEDLKSRTFLPLIAIPAGSASPISIHQHPPCVTAVTAPTLLAVRKDVSLRFIQDQRFFGSLG